MGEQHPFASSCSYCPVWFTSPEGIQTLDVMQTLLDAYPDHALLLDDEGIILAANLSAASYLGIPRDELLGRCFFDLDMLDPEIAEERRQRVREVLRTGEPTHYRRRGDDDLFDIALRPVHGPQGEPQWLGVFAHDVTEEVRTQEALQQSEARLRLVADFTYDCEYWINPDGDFIYVSPSCERVTGYSLEEFRNQPGLLASIIHPEDREEMLAHLEDLKDEKPFSREFRIIRGDDRLRWVGHVCQPVYDAQGRWCGRRASNRDITERRRVEEALRQQAVELQARNAELDAYAHTVAHDLKGPLSLVVGYAELLAMDAGATPPEDLQMALEAMRHSAWKMADIIDNLLLLASTRSMAVSAIPLNMEGIIAEVRRRLQAMIDRYDARISLPRSWPAALGYPPWVEEVWINYLTNAMKYGGTPPLIQLGAEILNAEEVCFWVQDSGPGIPEDKQAELFKPFKRLQTDSGSGHGLGLSIVLRIVERLGGRVGVESEMGEGSRFYFTLPRALS
ncbi:MAG: sensor histidine kinase [Anaerolineales bacterium]